LAAGQSHAGGAQQTRQIAWRGNERLGVAAYNFVYTSYRQLLCYVSSTYRNSMQLMQHQQ
jgi:hypothetical protein